jgi:hypothetical protein
MEFKLPDDSTWLDWYDNWLDNHLLNSNSTWQSPQKTGLWPLNMRLLDEFTSSRLSQ